MCVGKRHWAALFAAIALMLEATALRAQPSVAHLPFADSLHRPQPIDRDFHGCSATGRAGAPHFGANVFDTELNARKNRIDIPDRYFDITPSAILELPSPNLRGKLRRTWTSIAGDEATLVFGYEGLPVRVVGYVATDRRYTPPQFGAKAEGAESTNCEAGEHQGDVHVWITPRMNRDLTHAIVTEFTPRVREAMLQDAAESAVKKLTLIAKENLRVRVSGWLLFDEDHPEQLRDRVESDGKLMRQRRATLWEVHPVTELEVYHDGHWQSLKAWRPNE
jgi:hypothetical protein